MRHIDRLPEPLILAEKHDVWQKQFEDKRKIKANARPDSSKYGNPEIRKTLDDCSYHKCFYCESLLKGELKEIDHLKEVSLAPGLAYEWSNLYLSCNNCNDKIPHDKIPVEDVLNPCMVSDEEIKRNITFEDECICSQPGSEIGLNTIRKFRLNSVSLDMKRMKWLKFLMKEIMKVQKQMIVEGRKEFSFDEKKCLLRFVQPDNQYSLMCEIYLRKHLPQLFNIVLK